MLRCDCCQAETVVLIPVVNHDPASLNEHDLVCPACEEAISSAYSPLWNMPLFTPYHKRYHLLCADVVVSVA